ncbi:MAG TPA: SGNH/GDSL hydrolase family protein [Solirubrobacterales bacterium]|jgi:lysophospholipase L1-like esterase|nr:SGNH/GDSL hydrolase family protein [Solirubrobacterales bacterium]
MNAVIHNRPRGWSRALALGVLLALTLFAGALAAQARAANYTALGDSYAAGPLIPNQSLNPLGCLRSDHNYAHLAAPSIGLTLRDPSCSGARTNHMTESQSVEFGTNPPQFDSLDASTTVVSLTIGGNDIGFSEVAQSCITVNPFSTPCKDKYDPGGKDQLAERIAATAPKVAAVLQGIHSRSPAAKIYVVNYPAIFPETGFGCWPQMPIGFGDVPYLRSTEQNLNKMLATQAAANGATVVDWYKASIGHDACKSSLTRWVEPLVPTNLAAPIHPNLSGMQGGATALVAAVK